MTSDRASGFTLTEVLVAFAIIALSLTVLLPMIGDNLWQGSQAQQIKLAVQLAESKLAQLGALVPLTPGLTKGEQDSFRWQLSVGSPVPIRSAEAIRLANYDVVATVAWGATDAAPMISLRTQRLGRAP